MPFRKYTQCYAHTPGDKPFHIDDLGALALAHGIAPGLFYGALTGLAVGLLAGGPIGAVVGLFAGATVGLALALTEAATQWRYHRLVCLSGIQCAVGTVRQDPAHGDLGQFDNDEFFDIALMPHRSEDEYQYAQASTNYASGLPGIIDPKVQKLLDDHPKNDVFTDDFQGSALVRPSIADLPYDTTKGMLHCEAEGDFWERIGDLALALGALAALLLLLTIGATAGGAAAGASIGCAVGGIFGPIGCVIGAIIGAILGALLAGGAAAALSYLILQAILQAIFDADPGDVEDANVGDKALGPIREGDKVALLGEHVYDGFHEGWHEIHPLMAIVKLGDDSPYYLEWDPNVADSATFADLPGMPSSPPDQDITNLTPADVRSGLNSDKFRRRAQWLRDRWCAMLREAFDPGVRETQQALTERWTIHPLLDGCSPPGGGVPGGPK